MASQQPDAEKCNAARARQVAPCSRKILRLQAGSGEARERNKRRQVIVMIRSWLVYMTRRTMNTPVVVAAVASLALSCSLLEPSGSAVAVQTDKLTYTANETIVISLYNGSDRTVFYTVCGGLPLTIFMRSGDGWVVKDDRSTGPCAGGPQTRMLETGHSVSDIITGGEAGTYLVRIKYGPEGANAGANEVDSHVFTVR